MKATDRQLAVRLAELLANVNRQAGTRFLALLEERKLTLSHIRALDHIAAAEVAPSVSAMADWLGQSLPTASRLVGGLIERELVVATVDAEDRRSRRLAITGDGVALLGAARAARASDLESFVSTLSPDARARLGEALGQFDLGPVSDSA
jgi:DNA-binding MarR family transcriptional regulator